MKRNTIVPSLLVEKLIYGGNGLATTEDGQKIIITGGAIPGSVVDIRILKNKKTYFLGQIQNIVKKSPYEQELPKDHQIYGGCKWLPIPYEKQLDIKEEQIKEAFHAIKDREYMQGVHFRNIIPSPEIYGYRNKVEFSWWKYISEKQGIHDEYRFGFHEQGSFDRIIDCTNCVLADATINEIFHLFDAFARESGLPTYDQKMQKGFWRHLVFRQAKNTRKLMVIVSVNSDYLWEELANFKQKLQQYVSKITEITSLYILHNSGKADIVDGTFEHLSGIATITESLTIDGQKYFFEIAPKSFFQTNTRWAEVLYEQVRKHISSWSGAILDLYAGTGTIGIIVSDLAKQVYSIELVTSASQDNAKNLQKNNIENITPVNAKVEHFLESKPAKDLIENKKIEAIIVDPPRSGMHPDAPHVLPKFEAEKIIYVSCNPSTLVRDLDLICQEGTYRITSVQWVDMFPHTHHIEVVVVLEKIKIINTCGQ